MEIEKERNSTRISYLSKSSAGEVSEAFETVCSKVEGIYLPSDVQKEKESAIINIRHRESLKVYLEKNVFKIDDYITLLKRIKKLYIDLAENGYDPGRCLWDVDAVFVGESLSDLEAVYPVLCEDSEGEGNPLTDLLAVSSLHVFDSRDTAIEALSDVVKQFSAWERGEAGCLLTSDLFDESIRRLSSFASGSGLIRQYASVLANKFKKYVVSSQGVKPETRLNNKSEVKPKRNNYVSVQDLRDEKSDANAAEKRFSVFMKITSNMLKKEAKPDNKKAGNGFTVFQEPGSHQHGNGKKGLSGRLVNYEPHSKDNVDANVEKLKAETLNLDKTLLINRSFAEENIRKACPYISREHAAVICTNNKYLLSDKGSANGTYLNGEKVTPGLYYKLKKGDRISLGHRALTLRFDPASLN